MIHAYSELYIDDFQSTFGEMMDYATTASQLGLREFYDRFLSSGVARQIERGNPYYIAGLSGKEIAVRVLEKTGDVQPVPDGYMTYPGPIYWSGWALSYLQWYSGYSFSFLCENGFDADSVCRMYHPYHEVPLSKFVDDSMELIKERNSKKEAPLKALGKVLGCSSEYLLEQ